MFRLFTFFASVLALLVACDNGAPTDKQPVETAKDQMVEVDDTVSTDAVDGAQLSYPETRKVEQTDDYHGTEVEDPYRWLEQDVRESEAVADWVAAQNETTFGYLETLPGIDDLQERMTELWNFARFSVPTRRGDRYFFSRNDGLQNQSEYVMQEGLEAEPQLLIDPNSWSEDGTVALAQTVVSDDGSLVAYGIQDGGSDWRTWKIMEVDSGKVLEDELQWLKFNTPAWSKDNEGFYYSRYPEPESEAFQALNKNMAVYYHRVGTDQSEDTLIYERPDHPDWGFQAEVTDDGRYLVITIWLGTDDRYQIATRDLSQPDSEVSLLIEGFDHDYTLVGSQGSTLFFRTTRDAPRGRVVGIDLDQPDSGNWTEVVPQADEVMTAAEMVGGRIVAHYLKDARSELRIHALEGTEDTAVTLPGIGSVSGFNGSADRPELFYQFSSFNRPPAIYRFDVQSGEGNLWKSADVAFNPDDYEVRQVFYASKDGTRIPMFITHRKGMQPNGEQPTLLYGYGGFNISITPTFSVPMLTWLDQGGVFAQVSLRGGGEYGESWHKAGTKTDKQNVFDDYIAAAEYLVSNNYTSSDHLAIYGRSNGGLLVGATLNQRPDLFAAALPVVGVMDMLRFQNFTAGRFWTDDYGSSENPEEFEALYAYSPYHNIEETAYPPVLVTTADTDDRVVPGHSFKYIARLQEKQQGDAPVLIRIETRAGHGAGKPVSMQIEEWADMLGFVGVHTGLIGDSGGVSDGGEG